MINLNLKLSQFLPPSNSPWGLYSLHTLIICETKTGLEMLSAKLWAWLMGRVGISREL